MIRILPHSLLVAAALLTPAAVHADASDRIRELAANALAELARSPELVAAVKARNAAHPSLDEVKALDAKWQATPGVADFMKALIDSPAGRHLQAWRKAHPYVSEIIVMDALGANVALTEKTSDYWQGDEAKFTDCFKEGGIVVIHPMVFDESSQTYSVQVSLPIKDGEALIGAVCVGLDVEQLGH